jgi:polysaccharide export outer membrane protein
VRAASFYNVVFSFLVAFPATLLPAAAHAQQSADYTLLPGDQLDVAVWREPDLTRKIVVRPDGKFSFPLVGEILAQGRSAAQITTEIESRLKKYIPEPVVTVSVTEILGNRIYVIGQVKTAGSYVMNPQLTIMQALSLAGGTTPFAKGNDILILRSSQGQQQTLRFRMDDVVSGRSVEQNVLLKSGDVVIVP